MATPPRRPDNGDVPFDDWDSALDEWDAHFESMVEHEVPPGQPAAAAPVAGPERAPLDDDEAQIEVEFDDGTPPSAGAAPPALELDLKVEPRVPPAAVSVPGLPGPDPGARSGDAAPSLSAALERAMLPSLPPLVVPTAPARDAPPWSPPGPPPHLARAGEGLVEHHVAEALSLQLEGSPTPAPDPGELAGLDVAGDLDIDWAAEASLSPQPQWAPPLDAEGIVPPPSPPAVEPAAEPEADAPGPGPAPPLAIHPQVAPEAHELALDAAPSVELSPVPASPAIAPPVAAPGPHARADGAEVLADGRFAAPPPDEEVAPEPDAADQPVGSTAAAPASAVGALEAPAPADRSAAELVLEARTPAPSLDAPEPAAAPAADGPPASIKPTDERSAAPAPPPAPEAAPAPGPRLAVAPVEEPAQPVVAIEPDEGGGPADLATAPAGLVGDEAPPRADGMEATEPAGEAPGHPLVAAEPLGEAEGAEGPPEPSVVELVPLESSIVEVLSGESSVVELAVSDSAISTSVRLEPDEDASPASSTASLAQAFATAASAAGDDDAGPAAASLTPSTANRFADALQAAAGGSAAAWLGELPSLAPPMPEEAAGAPSPALPHLDELTPPPAAPEASPAPVGLVAAHAPESQRAAPARPDATSAGSLDLLRTGLPPAGEGATPQGPAAAAPHPEEPAAVARQPDAPPASVPALLSDAGAGPPGPVGEPAAVPLPTAAEAGRAAPGPAPVQPDPFLDGEGIDLSVEDVAETGDPLAALPADAAPLASRLPVEPPAATLRLPALAAPPAFDETLAHQERRLFEGEMAYQLGGRARASLECAAARAAERAGDAPLAHRLYQEALGDDAGFLPALRALRRLALDAGDTRTAVALVAREAALAPGPERAALTAIQAELLVADGGRDSARELFGSLLGGAAELWARSALVDLAVAAGADPSPHLQALGEAATDPAWAAALAVERGRLAVAAGRRLAEGPIGGALAQLSAAGSAPAGLALLIEALRTGDASGEALALERCEAVATGRLRVALRRRLAALHLAGDHPDRHRLAAQLLEGAVDAPSLATRLDAELGAGRAEAAEATLTLLADLEQGAARCDRLLQRAEMQERRGALEEARASVAAALEAAPDDLRATTVAARIRAALAGPAEAAARDAAPRSRARQLQEAGQYAVALGLLSGQPPPSPPPLGDVAVDLLALAGREAEAGERLQRAAEGRRALGQPLLGDLLTDRAARLLWRAGKPADAAVLLRSLARSSLAAPSKRLLARLLALTPKVAEPGELAALRATEASRQADGPRSANGWFLHALAAGDAQASSSLLRAVERDPDHAAGLVLLELVGERAAAADLRTRRLRLEPPLPPLQAALTTWRAALAFDALADRTAGQLLQQARGGAGPGLPLVEDRLLARAHRLADREAELALLERQHLGAAPGEQVRSLVLLAERRLGDGEVDVAVERYRAALALDVDAALARPGLERALTWSAHYAELAELLRADLPSTTDARARMALLERIAIVESELAGEPARGRSAFRSLLELDHANHCAFRTLERLSLIEDRPADRIALYAQMGLSATDPGFATAVILERARLRRQVGTGTDDLENDLRQALFKDSRCRPALRQLLRLAEDAGRGGGVTELCDRLAADAEMPARSAAAFLWRAGDALLSGGRVAEGLARYRASLRFAPGELPALRVILQLSLRRGAFDDAAAAAEEAAAAARAPGERLRLALVAGHLLEERVGDRARAQASWMSALTVDPMQPEAFARLCALLDQTGDDAERARVLALRADVEPVPARAAAAHLELALLLRDKLGDLAAARAHLIRALELDGEQPPVLAALADIDLRCEQWQDAAEVLIRCARVERDPGRLKEVFLHLGAIYRDHLPDRQRAIVSYSRVLQLDPDDPVALEQSAALHEEGGDAAQALPPVLRMAEVQPDPVRRIELLQRAAHLQEQLPGGERGALELLRRALAVDPQRMRSILSIAELFERRGDPTSARVHLDTSTQLLRQRIARQPLEPTAYRGLYEIFHHRGNRDAALMAAAVLHSLGAATADEQALVEQHLDHDVPARAQLADPAVDDLLFDQAIPPGFRNLLSRLNEVLSRLLRGDIKRYGVGKGERLPRVHIVREIASQVAADLGVRDVDIYVSPSFPSLLALELTDPISLIAGEKLLSGAVETELRFLFARMLKPVQAGLAVALKATPDELGLLVGGLVRQYMPDFVPGGFDTQSVMNEAARLARALPRRLQQDVMPFALECAAQHHDWRRISALVHNAGNRAGLLAAGSIPAALSAVRRLGDEAQLRDLLLFAVSEEHFELRRLCGVALP